MPVGERERESHMEETMKTDRKDLIKPKTIRVVKQKQMQILIKATRKSVTQ